MMAASKIGKPTFPLVIERRGYEVKIYHGTNKGIDADCVAYYVGGGRKRVIFSDFDKAKQEAKFATERMSMGEASVLELTRADRIAYQFARQQLDPLGVTVQSAATRTTARRASRQRFRLAPV